MAAPREHAALVPGRRPFGALGSGIAAQAEHRPDFDLVKRFGNVRHFERDAVLFAAGDTPDFRARLVAGVLRIATINGTGRRRIVAFLYPGDALSTRWLCDEAWSLEGVTTGTLISCPQTVVNRLVTDDPDGALHLLMDAERQLVDILRQRSLVAPRYAAERLAGFLLCLADRWGAWSADGAAVVDLPMSRSDVADHLALTVETVSRALTRLRLDGLIALPSARRLVLLRPLALRRMVDEGVE